MFERILVPTDGSSLADVAAEVGRKIAARENARLILVRVEPERAGPDDVLAATATVEQQAAALRNMGHTAAYRIEYGRPEEGIAAIAAEEDSQLIVMAHHRRGHLEALYHPSVTTRLLSRSPAPILAWPEAMPAAAADRLLMSPNAAVIVPLDGSLEAERALPLAVAFARIYGRPLTLLRVVVTIPYGGAVMAYAPEVETRLDDEREAREYLTQQRGHYAGEENLSVQTMLLAGDAASEIVREASSREGSLIVMSTHGRTGLGKLLLGSVAAKVLEHTGIPLLIVPPEHRATEKARATERVREPAPVGFIPMF